MANNGTSASPPKAQYTQAAPRNVWKSICDEERGVNTSLSWLHKYLLSHPLENCPRGQFLAPALSDLTNKSWIMKHIY